MNKEIKSYRKEDYVSVWIGRCESMDLFNEYICLNYYEDSENEKSKFELGNDFGILSYDEDFSLVYFTDEPTTDLSILLDTGAPEYVLQHFLKECGNQLEEEFNCCVMFYDMQYHGECNEAINEIYGKFIFIGSVYSDKFDML